MKIIPIKRALISVSDKTNITHFAKALIELDIEIISTGGTSQLLTQENIPHKQVDDVTGMSEMMDGRVKTLHPRIHAGILGRRDQHALEAAEHNINWIDLVVVNFYPFKNAISKPDLSFADAIEYIDIGGPTMVRASAKNMEWVCVVTDPNDYDTLIAQLKEFQGTQFEFRKSLAQKAFALTKEYDTTIYNYLSSDVKQTTNDHPNELKLTLVKQMDLRYGENPHQKASAYAFKNTEKPGILAAKQLQGKPLSYNNILDAEAALSAVREFNHPASVIVKHANPSGASVAHDIDTAFSQAYHADSLSAFGGIVALNKTCTKRIAEMITSIFMEVIIAPDYEESALQLFANKPNLRVLQLKDLLEINPLEMKFIQGGLLLQERDNQELSLAQFNVVTKLKPRQEDLETILFAWRVVKHVKSNAILIAKNKTTCGIGGGLVSRVDAVDLAIKKADENIKDAVLASDAFFPFRDSIDRIAEAGIQTIIQPGGSMRDDEVIAACNEHNIAMIFTGVRCFRH